MRYAVKSGMISQWAYRRNCIEELRLGHDWDKDMYSMVKSLTAVLVLCCSLAAQSQPAGSGPSKSGAVVGSSGSSTNQAPTFSLPSALTAGYVPDDKYQLRAGDSVTFQILEDKDDPVQLLVADSGELHVPYIGRVPAAGKTCKVVAEDIKKRLEKEYYYRATVILALEVANKVQGRVYVWGQVKNQGVIELQVGENLTAGRAILRAGGFSDFANKKKVKVIRETEKGKKTFELNMAKILEDGDTEKDLLLQPEDFIIVPSRLINF